MSETTAKGAALVPERPEWQAPRRSRWQRLVREINLNGQLYLLVLPVVVGFFLFQFVPMYGLQIAFKDYNLVKGVAGSEWVGLENFEKLVDDPFFYRVVKNTVVLGFWTLVLGFPLPILFALSVNEIRPQHPLFKRVIQSISYLPHFVAVVIIVGLMYEFFSSGGIVNQFIEALGFERVKFLGTMSMFRPMYLGSAFYQTVGWSSIIYLAALAGIPVELYEAAHVDGASRWQRIRYITLPGLAPTIRVLFILSVSVIVSSSFERAYLLQTPGTFEVSDVLDTYVYRRGLVRLDFSYGAAVGLFNSVVAFIFVFFTNWFVKRTNDEGDGLW